MLVEFGSLYVVLSVLVCGQNASRKLSGALANMKKLNPDSALEIYSNLILLQNQALTPFFYIERQCIPS